MTHRYAYVRLGKCLTIVDTVTYHSNNFPLRLKFFYKLRLIGRHDLAFERSQSYLLGNGFCCLKVISCEHIYIYTNFLEFLYC